jgi:hypothetical protein
MKSLWLAHIRAALHSHIGQNLKTQPPVSVRVYRPLSLQTRANAQACQARSGSDSFQSMSVSTFITLNTLSAPILLGLILLRDTSA